MSSLSLTAGPAPGPRSAWQFQSVLAIGALPTATPCARLHARNIACEWGLHALADTIELVVSELVTNAVKASTDQDQRPHYTDEHGLAWIHVRREALTIRVEVRDLPPLALSQQGGEAGGSRPEAVPQAAPAERPDHAPPADAVSSRPGPAQGRPPPVRPSALPGLKGSCCRGLEQPYVMKA
jgi:hypothetical protein